MTTIKEGLGKGKAGANASGLAAADAGTMTKSPGLAAAA